MLIKFTDSLFVFTKKAKRTVDWKWFRIAWDDCSYNTLFDVWNDARTKLSLDAPYEIFDKAYQYRNPFTPNYKSAKREFLQMVIGFW
jgi:hypothetical protein